MLIQLALNIVYRRIKERERVNNLDMTAKFIICFAILV